MKRTFESGSTKRRRKEARYEAEKKLCPITAYLKPEAKAEGLPVPDPLHTSTTDDEISNTGCTTSRLTSDSAETAETTETETVSPIRVRETIQSTSQSQHSQYQEQEQLQQAFNDNKIDIDIGVINKSNAFEMKQFLKITKFYIPSDLPRDKDNHAFPTRLLTKHLPNGEKCIRDWLCWSEAKASVYCAPCFVFKKGEANPSILSAQSGWDINRGWRKLKDRIPSHENSITHRENYVCWKSAQKTASENASVDNLLLTEISTQANYWKTILQHILNVILFLAERGLSFFGSSKRIGKRANGNFLGLISLLSKYDPLLSEHVKRVRESQEKKQRLQVHYLSTDIQNEFIEICGAAVQTAIITDIKNAKYFSIIVDATPDYSHMEQTTLIIRYVKMVGNLFTIEERFVLFDNFTKKTGKEIAARVLENVERLQLDFKSCIGQAYDNGSNMAGAYNGVQAVLLRKNSNCIFSSCGNHTLNLVGVDCAESCTVAVTYFGTIQQMYNLFSSSPQRWEILKNHLPVSLHGLSTTRWAARIAAVKPVAHHLLSVINAVSELSSLNLTAQTRTEVQSIKKYISTLEFIVMSSMWVKLLTMIHETNLIIEARNATLDEEKDNIESLTNDIMQLREKWNAILSEAKLVAESIGITCEFSTRRNLPTQSDAEQHYRVNVFYVIVDSITSGLTRRFSSLQVICKLFGFLWKFNELSNEDPISAAKQFQEKYNNDVTIDLGDELVFLKRIYSTNFDTGCTPSPKVLLTKILEFGLTSVFPNIVIALRIFVSLPASVASGERSFSVLKQIKNYSRSTMGQERLNGLAMIYINNDVAQGLDYSSVISTFAEKKARKALIH